MRDDSDRNPGGTGGTHSYSQDATQAERRAMLRKASPLRPGDHEPTTYAAIAQAEDDLGGRWAEPKYPAGPAWSREAASLPPEEPLGIDVNELPDCSGIGGRGGPSDEA